MKKITFQACAFAALSFAMVACGGNHDESVTDSTNTSSSQTTVSATKDSPSSTADNTMAEKEDDVMSDDQKFAMEAANGGMMEVEMGNLAASNGASQKVKDFGKMMVTDHTKANNELKAIAGKKNMSLPAGPNEMHQQHLNGMKEMKGKDFDKAYVDMMVNDHDGDVAKFEQEASSGKDADVKAFAAKTLPVLKKHLSAIKAIQGSMK